MQTFQLAILLLLSMSTSFRQLVQDLMNTKWVVKIVVALVFVKLTSVYMVRPRTEQRREPQEEPKGETPSNEYHVYVDASDRHVGGVILKAGRMVGKHTQKLRGANKKLTTGEKELLGIVEILRHYRNLVFGLKLVVHTNHKHLLYESSSPNQTIVEWRALLEEYNVRYEAYDTPKSSLSSSYDSPSKSTKPKPTPDPQASKKAPPETTTAATEASSHEIAAVGSDDHPGLEAFYRWCEAESSLYRAYTLVPKDQSVPTALPPKLPWGRVSIELTVTNLTNRAINVFLIDRKDKHVFVGTIQSQKSWKERGHNNSRWVFEDALTAKPVLYYVPYKAIPYVSGTTNKGTLTKGTDGITRAHAFYLVPPEHFGDGDGNDYHIGVDDRQLPFPASRHLKQPIDAINWTIHYMYRCCKASSYDNWILAEANTLQKYMSNILNHPENWKYRNLRIAADRFSPIWGSSLLGLLLAVGFVEDRGFCRLGRSDSPLPNDRIRDVSRMSFLLADWIWRRKNANGHKTKLELEWNETPQQYQLSDEGEALRTALYQSKLAAIKHEAQSEHKEWSESELKAAKEKAAGVAMEELVYEGKLNLAQEALSENESATEDANLKEALYQSQLQTAREASLRGDNPINNGNAPGRAANTGSADWEKAPNGAPSSSNKMTSSSSHGSPPSSDDGTSASQSELEAAKKEAAVADAKAPGMPVYQSQLAAVEQAQSELEKLPQSELEAAMKFVAAAFENAVSLRTAVYQSKLAAVEHQAQSELKELSQSELEAVKTESFSSTIEELLYEGKLNLAREASREIESAKEDSNLKEALYQSQLQTTGEISLLGDNPIVNANAPGDAADAGSTDWEKAPNGAPPSSNEMTSSSSHSSPPSSDEGTSASNGTSSEWDLMESQSSDGASPYPRESNNSVSTEGPPADVPQVSGSAITRKRRTRFNPSDTSDPERKRQLEARLAALEERPKASTQNKGKKSRPLSSPHTNMMKW